jgi:hypothetical protein
MKFAISICCIMLIITQSSQDTRRIKQHSRQHVINTKIADPNISKLQFPLHVKLRPTRFLEGKQREKRSIACFNTTFANSICNTSRIIPWSSYSTARDLSSIPITGDMLDEELGNPHNWRICVMKLQSQVRLKRQELKKKQIAPGTRRPKFFKCIRDSQLFHRVKGANIAAHLDAMQAVRDVHEFAEERLASSE